jgi:2-dehydropantoate 2-reductase
MRIAIIGAGGVGGTLAADLVRSGASVSLLARGSHLEKIRAEGLRVETPDSDERIPIDASDNLDQDSPFDLVAVAVKSWSLEQVAPAVRDLAARGADVLPLLNGVDAADRLVAAGIARDQVLNGLVYVSATRVGPGHVRRTSPFRRAMVGEPGGGITPRAERVAATFNAAGWETSAVPDIDVHLWRKYIFITAFATACALTRTPIGLIRDEALGPLLLDRAVDEIIAVAARLGIAIPDGERERVRSQLDSMPAAMMPSLLHDLLQGGPTEVDALTGGISRLGRSAGVPTPIHDAATVAIHAGLRSSGS